MKLFWTVFIVSILTLLTSCQSKKKLKSVEHDYSRLDSAFKALQVRGESQKDSITNYRFYTGELEGRVKEQKRYNDDMVDQLKRLSVISDSQAESIRKSLENISGKDSYIKNLQSALAVKDSLLLNLVTNLKGALGDLDDNDVQISIDKGVIFINISDKLLFETGSYRITDRADVVLGKVAKVLLNHPAIEFMVEGHTDTVPFRQGVLLDNWDLSVKRATAVVRILQNKYNIPPEWMIAAGRGEYIPVASNDTQTGRSMNRRTRILILPELDQFFKLLEKP